ncbi:hypothetical protein HLH33_18440 [Gluconacetobacter diazotrophicus]|uniref:Uncharacterized protein n=1 Tax=Gluconacetobacter diazotrophicus TaxID=33996 RepID=A0A7W4NIA3_GLUDI|nr:hypothetical protein [Gluconacetobacter diazotrophicus]MBB2158247.1 hypothetical protein [Gluconacetobacter diazotrophicus]
MTGLSLASLSGPAVVIRLVAAAGGGGVVCGACLLLRAGGWGRVLSAGRAAALALAIPGVVAAALPGLVSGDPAVRAMLQGFCLVPLVLLAPLRALDRLPPGLTRTAAGLGAGPGARARGLWLPLLGPAGLVALGLAAGGAVLAGVSGGR